MPPVAHARVAGTDEASPGETAGVGFLSAGKDEIRDIRRVVRGVMPLVVNRTKLDLG